MSVEKAHKAATLPLSMLHELPFKLPLAVNYLGDILINKYFLFLYRLDRRRRRAKIFRVRKISYLAFSFFSVLLLYLYLSKKFFPVVHGTVLLFEKANCSKADCFAKYKFRKMYNYRITTRVSIASYGWKPSFAEWTVVLRPPRL